MKLRFTIRDLLWLAAVVALAVGWWLDHRSTAKLRDENTYLRINLDGKRMGEFDRALEQESQKKAD